MNVILESDWLPVEVHEFGWQAQRDYDALRRTLLDETSREDGNRRAA